MIPRSPVVRISCRLLVAFVGFVLAACESGSAPPLSVEEGLRFVPVPKTIPLTFNVMGPSGAVEGAFVRVYKTDGPIGDPQDVHRGLQKTDQFGNTTFDLPAGDYCASVRLAPPEWAGLTVVTPLDDDPQPAPTEPDEFLVPVVRVASGYVAFSPTDFADCYTNLYIEHKGSGTTELVTMLAASELDASVTGPSGNVLGNADVYAVIPVCVPWVNCNPSSGIKPGFFSFLNRANPLVVSPNAAYALEFQAAGPNGFNLTASCRSDHPTHPCVPTGATEATLEAAPLMCVQNPISDPTGEQTIDFVEANVGYHANLALSPDLGIATVELKHTGVGAGSVTFRTDLPGGGRYTSTIDFECTAADGCSTTGISHTGVSGGVSNPQTLQAFYRTLSGGVVDKTTIVLSGIPLNHRELTFSAKSAGDAIPNASKKTSTSAFFKFQQPTSCSVAASNDDKWFVGEI